MYEELFSSFSSALPRGVRPSVEFYVIFVPAQSELFEEASSSSLRKSSSTEQKMKMKLRRT